MIGVIKHRYSAIHCKLTNNAENDDFHSYSDDQIMQFNKLISTDKEVYIYTDSFEGYITNSKSLL